jgi:MFS family permease
VNIIFQNLITFFTRPASRAVGLIFSASGLTYGSWAAMIPLLKVKFGLDDAQLGMLLFSFPFGVMVANPLAAVLIQKIGMRQTTFYTLICSAPSFIILLVLPSVWMLAGCMIIAGLFFSMLNMGMNTSAVAVEQHEKRRIMSTCHGLWSFGAMSGSALASTFMGLGVLPVVYIAGMAAFIFIMSWIIRPAYMRIEEPVRHDDGGATFTWPTPLLWGLIILSLCTNLTEGSMADWAGVYMREIVQAPAWLIGWGFASYAFFMAAGRFAGDALLMHFGNRQVLQVGGVLVVSGLLLAILVPVVPGALIGFALVGAGVSSGAPVLYGSSARVPGMAPGAGLATMNTFSMLTFLAGPTIIGFISRATSLRVALAVVAAGALFWVWKAGRAKGL